MIHKLANGPLTMTIAAVDSTEGNFGPQVCFTGDEGTSVYISELSATKQIARLNMTMEETIGQTLFFEQVKKDGKTYTNIALAGGMNAKVSIASASGNSVAAAAPKAPADLASLAVLYSECVDIAMATLGVKCEGAGVPYDAAAIQSAAATLFIKATR
jgi:hypothetical protein